MNEKEIMKKSSQIKTQYNVDAPAFKRSYSYVFPKYFSRSSEFDSDAYSNSKSQSLRCLSDIPEYRARMRSPKSSHSVPIFRRHKSFKSSIFCSNCGGKGHMFKECKKPIRSYGIIAFRRDSSGKLQVCLIRRKNTISYEAFIRGKFKMDELSVHLERMTTSEKQKIKQSEWSDLYNEICYHRSSKHAQRERKKAKDLYDSVDVCGLFDDVVSEYDIPEWEFPKGRKYFNETQEQCALREFREETNIRECHVNLLYNSWFETFEGTNKRTYQNQYFLALIDGNANEPYIDLSSRNQITEIGDVDWFDYDEAINLIRDYHTEKKKILTEAFETVSDYL